MALKTSFCNKSLLKKDLTRFAPIWGVYTVCLLLGLLLIWDGDQMHYYFASNFSGMINNFSTVCAIYALCAAGLLFGDLYNPRMCCSLHALPLKRQEIFRTHVLSGLLMHLVPSALMALVAMPILSTSSVERAVGLAPVWWVVSNLEYLFYFSLAAFCALCAGNWLGLTGIYALCCLGSLIPLGLFDSLYQPLLSGVRSSGELLQLLSPVIGLVQTPLTVITRTYAYNSDGTQMKIIGGTWKMGENWGYLGCLVALALVLLMLGQLLYRRRNMETAGDFSAWKGLEKPLHIAMALACAALGVVIFGLFRTGLAWVACMAGLVMGWLLGAMLLERSARIFRKRQLIRMGALAAALLIIAGLTKLDPLGIRTRIPETDGAMTLLGIPMESEEERADMRRIHALALEQGCGWNEDTGRTDLVYLTLQYQTIFGSVRRDYHVPLEGELGSLLKKHTSTVKANLYESFEFPVKDAQELLSTVRIPQSILLYSETDTKMLSSVDCTEQTVRSLYEAFIADCEEGNLSIISSFYALPDPDNPGYTHIPSYYLHVRIPEGNLSIHFYPCSTHLCAWAEAMGLPMDAADPYAA